MSCPKAVSQEIFSAHSIRLNKTAITSEPSFVVVAALLIAKEYIQFHVSKRSKLRHAVQSISPVFRNNCKAPNVAEIMIAQV